MKILLIADSHNDVENVKKILQKNTGAGMIIHLGDYVNDLHSAGLKSGKNVIEINGGYEKKGEVEKLIEIEGKKIYCTHGKREKVKESTDDIISAGLRNNASLVLFGHSHEKLYQPSCAVEGGPILFNPGAAKNGDYGIVHIDEKGIKCEFHKI